MAQATVSSRPSSGAWLGHRKRTRRFRSTAMWWCSLDLAHQPANFCTNTTHHLPVPSPHNLYINVKDKRPFNICISISISISACYPLAPRCLLTDRKARSLAPIVEKKSSSVSRLTKLCNYSTLQSINTAFDWVQVREDFPVKDAT